MEPTRTLNCHTKKARKLARVLLIAVPLAGLGLYLLCFRRHFVGISARWYWQVLLFAALYIADIFLHELIHGFFYKAFNPRGKLHFHFALLGSSCGMERCVFRRWQFVVMAVSPGVTLWTLNLALALVWKEWFACFYFLSVVGLASGNSDYLLAAMALRDARRGERIIDGGSFFEIQPE